MANKRVDISHVADFLGLPYPVYVTAGVWEILRGGGPGLTLSRALQMLSSFKGRTVMTRGNWQDLSFRVQFAAGVRFIAVNFDGNVLIAMESRLQVARQILEETRIEQCVRV